MNELDSRFRGNDMAGKDEGDEGNGEPDSRLSRE
jgi:hypothetical protein